MKPLIITRLLAGTLLATAALGAVAESTATNEKAEKTEKAAGAVSQTFSLQVHKSPTCGCCGEWVDHMEAAGFSTQVSDTNKMNEVKQKLGIGPRYQSCHTAVSEDGKYFFEGHVPAKVVARFLQEKPADAIGLAVPGMPVGSPGMEMGERFDAYEVMQINRDGSAEVYAEINSAEEQY